MVRFARCQHVYNGQRGQKSWPCRCIREHYQHWTEFDRDRIVILHEAGWSYHAIAWNVGHTDVTVTQCWNQCGGEGVHTCCEGSSRISEHHDIYAYYPDTDIGLFTTPYVIRTMSGRLASAGTVCHPMLRLPLTPEQRWLRFYQDD